MSKRKGIPTRGKSICKGTEARRSMAGSGNCKNAGCPGCRDVWGVEGKQARPEDRAGSEIQAKKFEAARSPYWVLSKGLTEFDSHFTRHAVLFLYIPTCCSRKGVRTHVWLPAITRVRGVLFEEGTVLGAGLQDHLCPGGLRPVQAGHDIVGGTRNPKLGR